MSRNGPIESANSTPCFKIPSILVSSNDSLKSYKSFNAANDSKTEKTTQSHSDVRALINKNRSLQEKALNAKLNDYDSKKKTFVAASKKLNNSYRDCMNMEGDTRGMEKIENFVKKHVFDSFTDNTEQVGELAKPLNIVQKPANSDLQTSVPEVDAMVEDLHRSFWDKIVSVVNVNNIYYQCMTQIMDTEKYQSIEDVKDHVAVALENGEESDSFGSELISCCKGHLTKFGIVLDKRSREELGKSTLLNSKTKLDTLKAELEEKKKITKLFENRMAVLKKEKRDLLNILHNYDAENIHKVSLKKQLQAEQETNNKLREMVSTLFKKKFPILNSDKKHSRIVD